MQASYLSFSLIQGIIFAVILHYWSHCETSLSTETQKTDAHARLSAANEDQGRTQGAGGAPKTRPQELDRGAYPLGTEAEINGEG